MTIRTSALSLALSLPLLALAPAVANANPGAAAASVAPYAPITVAEVEAAQRAWGDALVSISTEYERNGRDAAKTLAGKVLDAAYAYDLGPVLFKPTLTTAPNTFRTTRDGALAYFLGGDSRFPTDSGFALKGWRATRSRTPASSLQVIRRFPWGMST